MTPDDSPAVDSAVPDAAPVEQAPVEQAAPQDAPQDAPDDFDALLSEFDIGTAPAEPAAEIPVREAAPADDHSLRLDERLIHVELERWQEKLSQVNAADSQALLAEAKQSLKDVVDLPENYIPQFLHFEYMSDPAVQRAFDSRYESKEAFTRYERTKDRVLQKLTKAVNNRPDKQATGDREAVTAAVRGASTKVPEGKATDFTKMSDGEFGKEVQEKYGFRPF